LATWDLYKVSSDLPNGPYLAWTPDSKWLAFPYMEGNQEKAALFMISVDTGEKRSLTTVPVESHGDTAPAFSPDGRTLAFIRNRELTLTSTYSAWAKTTDQKGNPKRVRYGQSIEPWCSMDARRAGAGDLVRKFHERHPLADGGLKSGKPVRLGLASDNAWAPSISRTGKRLAYGAWKYDSNIWRVDLEGPGRMPGKPVQLISSTKAERSPAYSLDGKRIAFTSDQTGAPAVWICDSDGRNPVQVTSFGFERIAGLRWSPNGQSIAFIGVVEGNQDVYVVSAGGGAPQRLTTQPGADAWPFWSRDGRWVYFKSVQHGPGQVWKIPSQGGEAIQVTRTKEGADVPQESPDGKFLYYCRGWPFPQSIWKMPVEGGEETKVLDSVHSALWTLCQEGIYYVTAPDAKGASDLCLLEFVSGKIRKILRTERNLADSGSLAVSPDGRTILYGQIDEAGSDLMMVENSGKATGD
jgi:Tol biopolymer transport system component